MQNEIVINWNLERDSVFINQKEKGEEGFYVDSEDASIVGNYMDIIPLDELKKMFINSGFTLKNIELYEFTEHNQARQNSWWHVTLLKEQ